ncbi:MAG: methionyl-tRNA formyltransferase [Deltaproteobacteria bacterium]|nr:methionyl-tRNA formyltransferase [Deltaproteobacteria bacterium]MBI3389642.1 methionyl-tRNA formyltransferase [Deltaproteobacteria bacterium]
MRIILIGQAAFAEKVLDGLRGNGHDVAAVYCPPDAGAKPDPVKARALALGIPVRQHASLKRPEARQEFVDLRSDLAVLAYVTQIVPESVFSVPRLGSICFHPSLLPKYRGGSAIPWQLIRGETHGGVTVFWVDPGIDTGPILLQRQADIGPDETAGTLYFNKLFPLGIDAVLESVELIAAGNAPRLAQDESHATYDPLCRDEHASIDWSRPAAQVYNLIRGCDPQPGAYVMFNGEKLRLYDARCVDGVLRAGVVEQITGDGMLIGGRGAAIRVKRVRLGDKKVDAAAFAAEHGLSVGTRLG